MTIGEARVWLVYTSLAVTAATFAFFCIGPVLGFPLEWDQAFRLIEITLPTFFGYVGAAVHFVTLTSESRFLTTAEHLSAEQSVLLPLVVRGPVVAFAFACIAALTAFGVSNSRTARVGGGMSVDTLAAILSAALGLLTVSTSVLVGRFFGTANNPASTPARSRHA